MQLRSSPPSPFGRKVKIGAVLCGVHLDIVPADTNDPNDSLRGQNPLGKIPVLLREGAAPLYDLRVILEFLDAEAGGGRILPAAGEPRFAVLGTQALADGIMDAALLQIYEARYRPEEIRSEKWLDMQAGKVARGLKAFEAAPPATSRCLRGSGYRRDRSGLRARLSRPAFCRRLARGPSGAGRVARRLRRARADL